METIITWAKENYDLICLGVGVLGVLIGIISVIQARKQDKKASGSGTDSGRSEILK